MFIMNPCIICLEDTNKLFENENCKCKYNVHKSCLNKWSRHCIICKKPIINKQSWFLHLTTEWILVPLTKIAFVPILVVYMCVINAVYFLNAYVLESYDNIGR